MARFNFFVLAAIMLAGCQPAPPVPGPSSSAPVPKEYTCEFNRKSAEDFKNLPATSPLRIMVDDYRIERKALRAFHDLPEPPLCPP